jgi:uridine kinase
MSLIFISGVAGSGKSMVLEELQSRGYSAYGTDEDGFAHWHNIKTGYVYPKSSIKTELRTPEFIQSNNWKLSRNMVEELALKSQGKTVFLCGVATNENELLDSFTKKFALIVDTTTLKHRIASRTTNDYGKKPHELEQVLEHQSKNKWRYEQAGYTLIDATQPTKDIVNIILKKVGV